jgi:hypothetical protein
MESVYVSKKLKATEGYFLVLFVFSGECYHIVLENKNDFLLFVPFNWFEGSAENNYFYKTVQNSIEMVTNCQTKEVFGNTDKKFKIWFRKKSLCMPCTMLPVVGACVHFSQPLKEQSQEFSTPRIFQRALALEQIRGTVLREKNYRSKIS